jgi:two-component system, NtrC family, sensor kinase
MQGVLDSHLAKAIDHANVLVVIIDPQRRVEFANRTLAESIGATREELLGSDLIKWIAEEYRGIFERAVCRAQAGGVASEELGLSGNGEVLRGVFSLTPLPADDGTVEGVVVIGQDATEIHVLEHQVIQAEKLATLGQLAAGIVHEINNPLTSISVYADYLLKKFRKEGPDLPEVSMAEKIVEGSERILKCVRDLVNYAKPSRARLDVVSLNDVLERAVCFCEHIIKPTAAELHKELAFELPPLYGVEDQLQQVFINLVTNACHALPSSGGEIWIRTQDLTGGNLLAEVEDNGHGIAPEDLPHIFDPFFTTKKPGEGTGLGLSIVKKIVEFHHGSIMVRSQRGQGTVISVALPSGQRPKPEE